MYGNITDHSIVQRGEDEYEIFQHMIYNEKEVNYTFFKIQIIRRRMVVMSRRTTKQTTLFWPGNFIIHLKITKTYLQNTLNIN